MNHHIFAFDVDHTLEVSDGPIPISDLEELHAMGHIVGLCGNYAKVVQMIPTWKLWCNFIGSMAMSKDQFLENIKTYVPAQGYYMIGNDARVKQYVQVVSFDGFFAENAGWEFILEDDWEEFFSSMKLNS